MRKKEYTSPAVKTEVHCDDIMRYLHWQEGGYDFAESSILKEVTGFSSTLVRHLLDRDVWQVYQNKENGKISSIQVFKMNDDGSFMLQYEATEYGGEVIIQPNLAYLISGLEVNQ